MKICRWVDTAFFAVLFCTVFTVAFAQTGTAPTIASLSSSQTITEGQAVTLSVSVNGTAPFTYQWQREGVDVTGATSSSLVLDPIRVANAGTYRVIVRNAAGSVTSGPVVLAVNAAVAPTLGYVPSSASVVVGNTLSIGVSVSGTSPFTYTWKKDGTVVLSSTSGGYYTKDNAQAADAGAYTVTISNIAGSVTSSAINVTVNPVTAPTVSITSSQTVDLGDYFYIWSSVNGTGLMTYQWYKDGVVIPGANWDYYSKSGVTAADAGTYTLKVTNSAGSSTSAGCVVSVRAGVAATVSSASGGGTVPVGGSLSLYVNASGTSPLTYQWKKDGVAIAGATNYSYYKNSVDMTDAGAYTAVVTNAYGSATSPAVTVTVTNAQPPLITYMPGSRAVREGDYLSSISVSATGTGPLTYQWYKNGTAVAGGTSYSLNLHYNASAADAGTYTVVVTNTKGAVTSEPCTITILPPLAPTIRYQPAGQAVHQGQTISLSVDVSGTSPLTYQWRKDGVAIAGATSASYYKNSAASSDAGTYSVVVSNSAGAATSDGAVVTVLTGSAPKITAHPASASLLPGDYFYGMYVDYKSGDGVATVQWYKDGVAITGATSSSYSIYNAQPSTAGSYTAVVTNASGSVTSREGVITVDSNVNRPVITFVDGSRAVAGGNSVSLSFSTSGSGETVQWYKDGVAIPNGTTRVYSFTNFTPSGAGTYTAQVTNSTGTYTTRAIVLELLDSGAAPVITSSPGSVSAMAGDYLSLSVSTEGETPMSYQWKKDGVAVTGAMSNTYWLSNATAASAGSYTVVVTNRNGSATSAAAQISIRSTAAAAPVITAHPASQTVTVGNSLNVSVSVLDGTGVTYQWYKDGAAVSGGTNNSLYYYTTATLTQAGRYHVVVTNSAGSVTSNDGIVAVTNAVTGPAFTVQPVSQSAYYGNTVTFSGAATGTGTLTYQWRKDGTAITGATSSSLTVANAQSADAGTYTLVASDTNGSASSTPAILTLSGGTAPTVALSSGADIPVLLGASFTLSGTATGTPTPTLQWQKNGIDIPGATSATLTTNNAQAAAAGTYRLVARNGVGTAISSNINVTVVYPPPVITSQPTSLTAQPGGVATFAVAATTYVTATYQWRKDGVAIAGATSSSLVLTNVQTTSAGRYSVVVTTAFGSATSAEALLTVGNPVSVTAPQSQTVTVGGTATFSVTVVSQDPVLLRWAKNGVAIAGASAATLTLTNVQLSDAGTYSIGVSRSDGTVLYPLSGDGSLYATLTVRPAAGPVFTVQPVGANVGAGANVTFTAVAQGTGAISYQWYRNGQALGLFGDTLTLPTVKAAQSGDYTVVATDAVGSTTSLAARLTVTGSKLAGVYMGSTGTGDSWALNISDDGVGTFLAQLGSQRQAVVGRDFRVADNGTFSFSTTQQFAAAGGSFGTSWFYAGKITGTIAGGAVDGQFVDLGVAFSGFAKQGGVTPTPAGFFAAVAVASDLGDVNVITAPDGTAFLLAVDMNGVRSSRGTVTTDGAFTFTTSQYKYNGQLYPSTGTLTGTYSPLSGPSVSIATPAAADGAERLINVATRGLTASGDRVLTAGFVVSGSTPKDVLIRAVGPTLANFGLSGTLANPKLRLYRDGTAIMENDDWSLGGFANEISATSTRVGAFALPPGSTDAALVARLTPGAYSAQVMVDGNASGLVMVEVYDASSSATEPQKLINLSTRGYVDTGSNIIIAGIVVNGTSAKRLLIRGVGPALAKFGVAGCIADPKLQLFKGPTMIKENDNWSESTDTAAADAAARSVGAFPLELGSKDAAMLVFLAPGMYTAQVSGVGGTSGVAIVEVYEIP